MAKGADIPSPIPKPYIRYVNMEPKKPPINANTGMESRAFDSFSFAPLLARKAPLTAIRTLMPA